MVILLDLRPDRSKCPISRPISTSGSSFMQLKEISQSRPSFNADSGSVEGKYEADLITMSTQERLAGVNAETARSVSFPRYHTFEDCLHQRIVGEVKYCFVLRPCTESIYETSIVMVPKKAQL